MGRWGFVGLGVFYFLVGLFEWMLAFRYSGFKTVLFIVLAVGLWFEAGLAFGRALYGE